ncbi:hypothetical protein DFH29DRAFT_1005933 [Suillus ampliporus]|nr:hypothetical protein DFH29DRAFT_1005933 [Suillus ampliporus]
MIVAYRLDCINPELGVEVVRSENVLRTLWDLFHTNSPANIEEIGDDKCLVRLSAFIAYCELVENMNVITEPMVADLQVHIPQMLQYHDQIYQGRACAAFPALCKVDILKKTLLTEDLIHKIVDLCRTDGENKFIAARTLSFLTYSFDETSSILSKPEFIEKILTMLKARPAIVVVTALRILEAMSRRGKIPEDTLSGTKGKKLVRMFERLMKSRDFFVTPAAVAALCQICHNGSSTLHIPVIKADALLHIDQFRTEVIQCGVVATLIELFKSDNQGLSGGPRGLTELAAEFEDVRNELKNGSHIDKLVAFSKSSVIERSKEATEELTKLSEHESLRKQIIVRGGLQSMVDNLAKPDHALFAAHALLTLMKYKDAKDRILDTNADLHLLQMVETRVFDGTIGREGIDILSDIFKNDDLRSMMLTSKTPPSLDNGSRNFHGTNAPQRLLKTFVSCVMEKVKKSTTAPDNQYRGNIIVILHKMLLITEPESVQKSAVKYLRIIADYGDVRLEMADVGIVESLMRCLKNAAIDIQAVTYVLCKMALDSKLRGEIIKTDKILAEMLSSHYPADIQRVITALKSLSSHGEIRQAIRKLPGTKT